MTLLTESTGNQGQMAGALSAGLDVLDQEATVSFVLYKHVVLPADGFVFWVRAEMLNPSALPNTQAVNSVTPNQIGSVDTNAASFQARGSLHHTTVNKQDPDESYSINRMIFTSKDPVDQLAAIAPDTLYLGQTSGLRYAFSSRNMWYRQAALYHYAGDAVYPTLGTQVIDNPQDLNVTDRVVSNSLPIWLGLNRFFPIYPSMLVPDNIQPPYASIHIDESDTWPMQAGAFHHQDGSRWQLARDTVRITTYGVRNDTIMDWLDYVHDYTLGHSDILGVMNSPIPRDAKRGQTEISAIAQKKVITIEASYYQSRLRSLARKLILKAFLEAFIVPPDVSNNLAYA